MNNYISELTIPSVFIIYGININFIFMVFLASDVCICLFNISNVKITMFDAQVYISLPRFHFLHFIAECICLVVNYVLYKLHFT